VSEPKYLRIHLLVEDPAGAVPSARIDTPVGPLGKDTRLRAACDPSVTMGQYDRGTVAGCYRDLMHLEVVWGLSLDRAGGELVRRVRRHGGRLRHEVSTGGAVMLRTAPPAPARPPRPRPA
jgi:hypothetical protein